MSDKAASKTSILFLSSLFSAARSMLLLFSMLVIILYYRHNARVNCSPCPYLCSRKCLSYKELRADDFASLGPPKGA